MKLYFTAEDPGEDRRLILRTLAVLNDIAEIDGETTTGDAFRKYWRAYQERVTGELKPILEANIAAWGDQDI